MPCVTLYLCTILFLSVNISDNNVLHLCWDNLEFYNEMPSSSGTAQAFLGIAIKEVASSDPSSGVIILSVKS